MNAGDYLVVCTESDLERLRQYWAGDNLRRREAYRIESLPTVPDFTSGSEPGTADVEMRLRSV